MYTEAPAKFGLDPSQCLRLKRCSYGTRDEGQAFEFAVRNDVEVNNFSKKAYSPCVYRHKTLLCTVTTTWGLGAEVDLGWFMQHVSKKFIVKLRGYLGPAHVEIIKYKTC